MTWTNNGWVSASLADWLLVLRTNVQVDCGVTTQVEDMRYILARILLVLGNEFARADTAFGKGIAALDPSAALGRALDIAAYRLGLRRLSPLRTVISGRAYGGPLGLEFGGEIVKDKATGIEWQISAGTVGPFGYAEVTASAVPYGPVTPAVGGGMPAWERVSTLPGWTGFESLAAVSLGRDMESDADLLVRLQAAEAALGGTEAGVLAAIAQVSGIGVWRAYFNRSAETDDNGVPGFHIEVVATGGLDVDLARALRAGASGTAGFWGNTPVHLVSLQVGGTPVTVPITRPVPVRLYVKVFALITGAENLAPADIASRIRALVAAYGATLQPGEDPITALAKVAIVSGLPKGCLINLTVTFARDKAGPYTAQAQILAREYGTIANTPQQAALVSTHSGPYTITPGWVLRFQADGSGPLREATFTGMESAPLDIVTLINGYAWPDIAARVTISGFEVYRILPGALYSIDLVSGDASAAAEIGLPGIGSSAFGTDNDIEVTVG